MKNYRIDFYKLEKKQDEKGVLQKTGEKELLGTIKINDHGCDEFSVLAKAFRCASPQCLIADYTVVYQL